MITAKKFNIDKQSIFWKIFLAFLAFPSLISSIFLQKKYPLYPFKSIFENKDVFCLGTGPSLDLVNLSKIKNSTVFLLNGAIKVKNDFDDSNELIWLSQDINVMLEIGDSVPQDIKKILSFHTFDGAILCSKFLRKGDGFYRPKATISRRKNGVPWLWSKKAKLSDKLIPENIDKPFVMLPATVMFTAIQIAAVLNAKRIFLLGFDASHGEKSESGGIYSKRALEKPKRKRTLNLSIIESYLSVLLKEIKAKGIEIYNLSPLTSERILPKSQDNYYFN